MVNCCVPNCKSKQYSSHSKGIRFHEIPSDINLREKWLTAISRPGTIKGTKWVPSDYSHVCTRHFKPEDYREDCKNNVLKPGVVPSLLLRQPKNLQSLSKKIPKDPVKKRSSKERTLHVSVLKMDKGNSVKGNNECKILTALETKVEIQGTSSEVELETKPVLVSDNCGRFVTDVVTSSWEPHRIDIKMETGIKLEPKDADLDSEVVNCENNTSLVDPELQPKIEVTEETPWPSINSLQNEGVASCITGIDEDFPSLESSRLCTMGGSSGITGSTLLDTKHCLKVNEELNVFKVESPIHDNKDNVDLVLNDVKMFMCDTCDKSFDQMSDLRKHYSLHRHKRPHKCQICAKTFTQSQHLKTHILLHEGKRNFKCQICDKTFTQIGHLKMHTLTHEGTRNHKCEICDKSFIQLAHLKMHNLTHEDKRDYKCNLCDKKFKRKSNLKDHYMCHEGKKAHKCSNCDRSFNKLSNLKMHTLSHAGLKPFQCEVCSKAFTRMSSLKIHSMLHEGKTPYQCELCSKSFTTNSDLRKHSMIHEGKRPHECTVCEKRFSRKSLLKSHRFLHEGNKPHKCQFCDKSFARNPDLKRHSLKHKQWSVNVDL